MNRLFYSTILALVLFCVGARLWCNNERSKITGGWFSTGIMPAGMLSSVIYAAEHRENKATIWLMRQGF